MNRMCKRILATVTALTLTGGLASGLVLAAGMGNMGGMKMGPVPKHLPKPGKPISYAAAKLLIKYSNSTGMLMGHGKHKSVMFMGHHIHIVMVAVEPGAPDQTFEIHKLVDPEMTATIYSSHRGGGFRCPIRRDHGLSSHQNLGRIASRRKNDRLLRRYSCRHSH